MVTDSTQNRDEADPLLRGLTPAQREGVLHGEGPLLILAAAGSGKTRVITRRVAHLIRSGVAPWSILALTFTNKAAGEMRSRVMGLLGEGTGATRGLTLTTFHSLCARLLRRYASSGTVPGLGEGFSILDAADQQALMKKVLTTLDLSSTNWPVRNVLGAIGTLKNDLLDADAAAARATDYYGRTIAKIYAGYERALRSANACDFDDLLLKTAWLLRHDAGVLGDCHERWRYLMIDEYQDTNRAQLEIATMLARGTGNLAVVGDPDQAIYGWRGADLSNILDFEAQFPGAKTVMLGENFRSTAPILAVADRLIRHNVRRRHKDLFTSRSGGERVEVVACRDERHEAALVTDWLAERREREGLSWSDAAVFYRNNALSRVAEDALRAAGIPYVIARGTAFYQREEVKHALAYLRVLANPRDETSLERIANVPARGLGDASMRAIEAHARASGVGLLEALRGARTVPGLSGRAANAAERFVEMVDEWTGRGTFFAAEGGRTTEEGALGALVGRVLRESGLEGMYRAQDERSDTESARADNLGELVSSARQFELEYDPAGDPALEAGASETPPLLALLRAFLESVALVADADVTDPSQGAVTLMTLHAAKGLEFKAVAVIGLEEGLLPHARARESEAELEEERRLCFVGITRAMRRLLMTCASRRTLRGVPERTIPSRFIGEFDAEQVRFSDQSDAFAASGGAVEAGVEGSGGRGLEVKFPVGSTVRHPRFGVGTVESITTGRDARAQVRFRDAGLKTLVLEYAGLVRVG